jgi:autotransporter-associated beta strand protein
MLIASAQAQFVQSNAGTYSYLDPLNWLGGLSGNINGRFTQTPAGPQTVTFEFNTTLANGLEFNLGGTSPSLTLRSFGLGDRTLTLNGDVKMRSVAGADVKLGANSAGQQLMLSLTAGGHTFDIAGDNTLSVVNAITGAGGLKKTGEGDLYLAGFNGYTGGTEIAGGTVYATNASGSATGSGAVSIASGAVLSIGAGQSPSTGAVSGDIANDGAVFFARGNELTHAGRITGSGSVTQTGSGNLILTGANTYEGGTTIGSGTLTVGADNTLPVAGGVFVENAATLSVAHNQTVAGLAGTGSVVIAQDRRLTYASTFDPGQGADAPAGNGPALIVAPARGSNYSAFSGQISGAGGLTVAGTGTLYLGGANTYAGGTSLEGGVLQVSDDAGLGAATGALKFDGGTLETAGSFASNRTVELKAGGGTLYLSGQNLTLTGSISGAGGLTQQGYGILTLTGSNTYAGGTKVSGGFLEIDANANLGQPAGTLTLDGGSLRTLAPISAFDRTIAFGAYGGQIATGGNDSTFSGQLTGSGAFTKDGAGTLTLTSSANNYAGGTYLVGGTLRVGTADALPISTELDTNPGTVFDVAQDQTLAFLYGSGDVAIGALRALTVGGGYFSGETSGDGKLVKTGEYSLTLLGENRHAGGTALNGGSIYVSSDASLGAPGGVLSFDGGRLGFYYGVTTARPVTLNAGGGTVSPGGNVITLAGAVTGPGKLTVENGGVLALSGANTYAGGTEIGYGATLAIADDSSLGAGTSAVALNGGTLRTLAAIDPFTRDLALLYWGGTIDTNGFDSLFSGRITGDGAFVKSGEGVLTLTNPANQYAGWTSITGGTLRIGADNALPANTPIDIGRGNVLDVAHNQTAAYVTGYGTVSLAADATLTLSGGYAGLFAGSITGEGSLALANAAYLQLTGDNTYTGGTTIDGSTLAIGNGFASGSLTGPVVNNGQLAFYRTGVLDFASAVSGSGYVTFGGGGDFRLTGANTYTGSTVIYDDTTVTVDATDTLPTATALHINGNGTLQLNRNQTVGQLGSWSPDARAIIGAGHTLTVNPADADAGSIFRGVISGDGAFVKAGAGTLTLAGDNTYTGGTTIRAGQLVLGVGNYAGDVGSVAGDITVEAGGELAFDRGDDAPNAFGGIISGAGRVSTRGYGGLALTGNNTYTGGTTVGYGSKLAIAANANLGDPAGALTLDGGALHTTAALPDFARDILLGYYGGTIDTLGFDSVFTGRISGDTGFTKAGDGILTLAAGSDRSGGWTDVRGGTLRIGAENALPAAGQISVAEGATLDVAQNQSAVSVYGDGAIALGAGRTLTVSGGYGGGFSGRISGLGSLAVGPATYFQLSGDNSYAGGTTIAPGGVLVIGSGYESGSLTGPVANDGQLAFYRTGVLVFDGAVSGSGLVTFAGGGEFRLTGASTYTGRTAVFDSTTLTVAATDALPVASSVDINGTGTLRLERDQTVGSLDAWSGDSRVVIGAGHTLTVSPSDAYSGSGIAGIIGGGGALVKDGPGYLYLLADNTYTGGTTVRGGTLYFGNGYSLSTTGSMTGNIAVEDQATVAFYRGGDTDFSGSISGAGGVSVLGGGVLTLSGVNLHTGGTRVEYGATLAFSSNASLGDAASPVTLAGGTLRTTAALPALARDLVFSPDYYYGGTFDTHGFDSTLTGSIAGYGDFIKTGAGVLTLASQENTLQGRVVVLDGTLRIGADNTLPASVAVFIDGAGTLAVARDQATSSLNGSGAIVLGESRTLTLAGGQFDGTITGAGRLAVADGGYVRLTGANTYAGGTTIGNAVLVIGGGEGGGSLTGDVLDHGALSFQRGGAFTFAGDISGTGSLSSLAGTLTLTGANSYSGYTDLFNDATLVLGRAGTLPAGTNLTLHDSSVLDVAHDQTVGSLYAGSPDSRIALAAGQTLTVASGENSYGSYVRGVIAGDGAFAKRGDNYLTLAGDNTYTGGTTIDGGRLFLGNGFDFAGSILGNVTLANGASLIFNRPDDVTFAGAIGGSGNLSGYGSGSVTLTGRSTFSGFTQIDNGTLRVGAADALPVTTRVAVLSGTFDVAANQSIAGLEGYGAVALAAGKTLTLGVAAEHDSYFRGSIGGAGALTKTGDGVLTLAGANTFAGDLTISAGTVAIGGYDHGASLSANVIDDARLVFYGADDLAYTGVIFGSGALVKDGAGTLVLLANSPFSGPTTVNYGKLQLGNGGATGGISSGSIFLNYGGTLAVNRSDNFIYPGVLSGGGSFEKNGTGTLTIVGANTFSGNATINAGTLVVGAENSLPNVGVTVNSGATLRIAGNTSISGLSGSGTTTIDAGKTLSFFSNGGGFPPFDSVVSGAGNVAINGYLAFVANQTYTGTTTLGEFAGLAFGQGGTAGSVAGDIVFTSPNNSLAFDRADNFSFAGAISGPGSITKLNHATVTLTGASTYAGGTNIHEGTLAIGAENALPVAGTVSLAFGGTLAVARNQTIGGLTGPGTVSIGAEGRLTLNAEATGSGLQFDGLITGAGTFAKTGGGSLNLTHANTYAGGTILDGGLLMALNFEGSATGSGPVTVTSGTLQIGGGQENGFVTGNIIDNDRVIFANSGSTLYGGAISGTGSVGKVTPGRVMLTGASTYSGGTTINGGYLVLGNGGTTGSITGDVTFTGQTGLDGGELQFFRSNAYTFAGAISGPGRVSNFGTGTTTLAGGNTYNGNTYLYSGGLTDASAGVFSPNSAVFINPGATLAVGFNETIAGLNDYFFNGNSGGAVTIANTAALTVATGPNIYAFSGTISGQGSLVKTGTGFLTLTGANTFSGGTTINGGFITVGNGGLTGSLSGNVTFTGNTSPNGGELQFNRAGTVAFSGNIAGPGRVTNFGTGTLLLSGTNTYSGATLVPSGGLADAASAAFSPNSFVFLNAGAFLTVNLNETIGGLADYYPGMGGNVYLASPATLTIGAGSSVFSGAIAGPGALLKTGPGTLTLAGNNTYQGGTVIDAASALRLGHGGAAGSIAGDVTNNGALVFDRGDTLVFNGVITGTGTVYQGVVPGENHGGTTGTTILTAANNYTGGTVINSGTLVAGNNSAFGTGPLTINGGSLGIASGVVLSTPLDFGPAGGTLSGNGVIGAPFTTGENVTLSPGNSPGTLTFANSLTWAPGGSYTVEIASAAGNLPGIGFDTIVVSGGTFAITASSAAPFNLRLASLDLSFSAGLVPDFNRLSDYSWQIASSATGITGFSSAAFSIDTSAFRNPLGDGQFFVTLGGAGGDTAIFLNFTPVPEPSTWALLVTGLAVVAFLARRRRT